MPKKALQKCVRTLRKAAFKTHPEFEPSSRFYVFWNPLLNAFLISVGVPGGPWGNPREPSEGLKEQKNVPKSSWEASESVFSTKKTSFLKKQVSKTENAVRYSKNRSAESVFKPSQTT